MFENHCFRSENKVTLSLTMQKGRVEILEFSVLMVSAKTMQVEDIFHRNFVKRNGLSSSKFNFSFESTRQTMDAIDSVFEPLRGFSKDSVRLVKRCHKPDGKEYYMVVISTAIGITVIGFIGFFVKLIFIPINNIIVGSG
ncbi:hypothetical protein Ahy_B06g083400 [Arachis hypogaea]|uniref:Protein transport protein Sec61 subunit gamma n=2 Tax=Arachis TaxID=3817 RepID=A0A444YPY8_ARAHY|nr:hypothetical protein Ahy_B06g083400 [Arachis hypogaea]